MTDQPQSPYQQPVPLNPSDEKLWSTLVHVGGIFFHVLPALIGYLVLKDRGLFVREHTRAALNFQITLIFAYILGGVLLIVGIGILIIIAAYVLNIVFSILAAIASNNGQMYRYPLAIELVK
jgi:uncharacterized Tic20 family protein